MQLKLDLDYNKIRYLYNMASLIRLKQIESGSALQTSAELGTDFSQSVIDIIQNNVVATLPDGVVSSSAQILLVSASGYSQLATDIELSVVSGAVATTIDVLEGSFLTTSSFNSYTQSNNISIETLSSSIDSRVDALEQFSTSLDSGFATDVELAVTTSNLNIDMGEF